MDNQSSPILEVKDLKTYFMMDEGVVKAVDGVSFDVYPGQAVGIVGESGCGKSVTMRSVLRIVDRPGRIVGGELLFHPKSGGSDSDKQEVIDLVTLDPKGSQMRAIRGAEIALIPQEPMTAFSPVHTIGNQIMEAILLHQEVSEAEARQQAIKVLHEVGVSMPEKRLDAYSWQLSGGLRQRAIIAMALSCHPSILIADEPTTAIDVTTQAQILDLLRSLQQQSNTAIIFITHDLGVVAQMTNYVVVMYLGRVMEAGSVDEIFHAPKHPYTQALLRSIPSVQSTPRVPLPTITGSIPHPFNRPPGCPFHPRCTAFMKGICDCNVPELKTVDGQRVSCFLYQDVEGEDRGRA
ncbi:MAG: ABC transporter ATP-binding protein [Anaerolineae bacterium]|jgi:peptide/nickel transport system ATP-binding protein|nr:ABC transporter ATP-binding protein [Anaerolineae bacterium]